MPDYVATFYFLDVNNGETTKQHTGTFADNTAAQAALTALLNAYQGASSAQLYKYTLAETAILAGAPAAGTNVFERVQATLALDTAGKRASYMLPSPIAGLFPAGSNALDTSATQWTTLMGQFATGQWTLSDGEHVDSTVRGARIFVSSGKTNLPT